MNKFIHIFIFTMLLLPTASADQGGAVTQLLDQYQQQGAVVTENNPAQQLWVKKQGDRSCSSCHGSDLSAIGKHVKTLKPIQPMAASVNPKRYQKVRKIEKWFKRNCKWTFGRECTPQEKMNFLSWLSSQ